MLTIDSKWFAVATRTITLRCLQNTIIIVIRGVATTGYTGDAGGRVPRAPYHAPYIKMTTDSLSSELTFDE